MVRYYGQYSVRSRAERRWRVGEGNKRIRPYFLWDRKLLGLQARCAAQTIRLFYREMTGEADGVPGMVVSVQTVVAQFMNTMAFGC